MSSSSYSFVSNVPSTEEEFRTIALEITRLNPKNPRMSMLDIAENLEQLADYLNKFARTSPRVS